MKVSYRSLRTVTGILRRRSCDQRFRVAQIVKGGFRVKTRNEMYSTNTRNEMYCTNTFFFKII